MVEEKEVIERLRKELSDLIDNKADYNIILKKSQELDKYIEKEIKVLNKVKK